MISEDRRRPAATLLRSSSAECWTSARTRSTKARPACGRFAWCGPYVHQALDRRTDGCSRTATVRFDSRPDVAPQATTALPARLQQPFTALMPLIFAIWLEPPGFSGASFLWIISVSISYAAFPTGLCRTMGRFLAALFFNERCGFRVQSLLDALNARFALFSCEW